VGSQPSFADGVGSKTVFLQMLGRARGLIDGALVPDMAEVAAARLPVERKQVIAEGAGPFLWRASWPARRVATQSCAWCRGKHRPEDAVPGLRSCQFLIGLV
jgi:hypothetical protein